MLRLDLRQALRLLVTERRTSTMAVLMLSLGMGVNVALFTVINAAYLRPLPFREPDRLVFLFASFPGLSGADLANFSYPDFEDVRRAATSFEDAAAQSDFSAVAIDTTNGPARVQPNFIDGRYFEILGAAPALGRAFDADEARTGAPVMLLSHGAWQRLFGADPRIVGRGITVNGVACVVIGVMPARFFDLAEREGRTVDAWLPLGLAPRLVSGFDPANRNSRLLWGVARLQPGITATAAEQELAAFSADLERRYPDSNRGFAVHARPLPSIFFTELRQPLRLLAAGAFFVLLIVCANVSLLLVARGLARQREFALRLALGATPWRLVSQIALEALILAAVAGLIGFAIAGWTTRALLAYGGVEFPGFVRVAMDERVLLAAVALAALTALAAGIVPAISGLRLAVQDRLTATGSVRVTQHARLQFWLVTVQTAAAIVLVTGASLMVRSGADLAKTGVGFTTAGLLTIRLDLPADRYPAPGDRARVVDRLRDAVAAVPGVSSTTVWGPGTPGRATWVAFVAPEERPAETAEDFQMVWRHGTNPGGLQALGIPILEGRDFTSADNLSSTPVAIVGRTVARELWPDRSPIGRRLRTGRTAATPIATVVGVAEDAWMRGRFRFSELDPRRTPQRDIYFPYAQRPHAGLVVLARSSIDPAAVTSAVRAAVAAVDAQLPVYDVRTMDAILREEEQHVRFAAALMSLYGGMALLLGAAGLYGMLSVAVARRTREIGVRMALGARRTHIVFGVAVDGLRVVGSGLALGVAAIALLSPAVRGLLFHVSPLDPAILAASCVVLAAAGLAACAGPAWRAAGVDPSVALRD